MDKQLRCRVGKDRRPCGQPATTEMHVPELGRVPMCAACAADIQARIDRRIAAWAKQIAGGASVHDLH